MPDKPNHEEAQDVGQDKKFNDFTERYDSEVGTYQVSDGGKPTDGGSGPLPNTPSPFTLTTKK